MPNSEVLDLVRRSRSAGARAAFEERVDTQATKLRGEIRSGRFDNEAFTVGLELEAYAVDGDGRLASVPDAVFESSPGNPELGLHNVELNTAPAVLDADGVDAQTRGLREAVGEVRTALGEAGLGLVLDGMWTVPPPEGSGEYLSAVETVADVTLARNMRESPRYYAIDNDVLALAGGSVDLDLPGLRRSFPSILVESLTASIQPHLQIPDSDAFAAHYNVAIRTLGPVLALATNSPFLPADLYTEAAERDPDRLVDRTAHELRIPVFEGAINVEEPGKVRLPRDLDGPTAVVDRLVADRTCAPFLQEWVADADTVERYADRIWELDHKRGTYWRWLRAVVGGDPLEGATERSLRIEYRPLPTQPSVADAIGLQWLVCGLVRGLVVADHPLATLPWTAARESFYGAVQEGLDADLAWVSTDGTRTTDPAVVYDELFEYARRGLREHGLEPGTIEDLLEPIEARWDRRTTPSAWKRRAVRDRLDAGAGLREAIEGMQAEYVERCARGEPFVEW